MMIDYGGKELAAAFRTLRGNTLQTADDIPDALTRRFQERMAAQAIQPRR